MQLMQTGQLILISQEKLEKTNGQKLRAPMQVWITE